MKIGWLVWRYDDDEFPELQPTKPDYCARCVQIVYTEVIDN